MTFKKLFGYGILLAIVIVVIEFIFGRFLNIDSIWLQVSEWLLIAAFSIALSRRLGTINYLEAILVIGTWLIISLLFSYILLGTITFQHGYVWIGYLVMAVAIFIFHKKRHVEIRKQTAAAQNKTPGRLWLETHLPLPESKDKHH